jgi:hypothetical protein
MATNRFSYSAKFVCGTQAQPQTNPNVCFPVRPGTYATEINIYNHHLDQAAEVEKFFVPLVLNGEPIGREPRVAGVRTREAIVLKPQTGTMDDCCRIDEVLKLPSPAALTIGFLQIFSTIELSVTAVYTATDPRSNGLSIDVDQIQAKLLP